jgi:hypothetical protein
LIKQFLEPTFFMGLDAKGGGCKVFIIIVHTSSVLSPLFQQNI